MAQPKRRRVEPQERDCDFFATMFEYGNFINAHQLTSLFPNPDARLINPRGVSKQGEEGIKRRLIILKRAGYLGLIGAPHYLYFPTDKAAGELAAKRPDTWRLDYLLSQTTKLEKYLETDTEKDFFLRHRIGVNNFHTCLTLALRQQPQADWYYDGGLPFWLERKEEKDGKKILSHPIQVDVSSAVIPQYLRKQFPQSYQGSVRLGRTPDAEFMLTPDKNSDHKIAFIYEYDRGTEDHDVVTAKLFTYYQFHLHKLHYDLYGTTHLRVLVESGSRKTDQRLRRMIDRLCTAINKPQGSGLFRFTTSDKIDLNRPQSIFEPIWTSGHEKDWDTLQPLLEYTPSIQADQAVLL